MSNSKAFRILACMVIALSVTGGCWEGERVASEPRRELVAEFSLGDQHLKVTGVGAWEDAKVTLQMEYRSGAGAALSTAVDLVAWHGSDELRDTSSQFLASVDPEFLKYVAHQLGHDAEYTDDPDMGRLYHYLSRVVDVAALDGVAGATEPEKCYCSYCKVHHAPRCLSDTERVAD